MPRMFAFSNQFSSDRRQFLLASSVVAANALRSTSLSAASGDAVLLRPSEQDLFRVRVTMEVEGNVDVPKNPLVSRTSDIKLPVKSEAVFDYEERLRRPSGADATSLVTVAERYYHQAESSSLLNRNQQTCQLRESVRDTIVRRELLPEVIYAVDDYFHRDELELLRLPASSMAVDELLPGEAVSAGSKYTPPRAAVASVLNLTSVAASDVEAEVVSITDSVAKLQFRGKVDGSVDGVPTVIRTVGKLTFDRIAGACTWLAMAVHETREIGKAEPGFDVAATIKMIRKPLPKTIALSPQPPQLDIIGPIPSDRLYVDLTSDEIGISVLMDRRWRMMSDVPGAAMMRMIDNDRSIAQCDFRSLVALDAGAPWTLDALQADVRRTLGEQLTDLVEADSRINAAGLRVLRLVARGAVEGVPIQWVIQHFSDDSGRRVLATFTMEGASEAAFAGSDSQLAGTLRLIDRPTPASQKAASASRIKGGSQKIAAGNSDADSDDTVQSASDLR